MRSFLWLITSSLIFFVPLMLSGCKNQSSNESSHEDGGEHEHEEHAEGPHGGHLLELAGADKEYRAEWLHDDEDGIVTVCLLEDDGKTPLDNPPEAVTIEVRSGNSPMTYELTATDTVNDIPAQSAYSITDPTLVTALEIIVEGEEPLLHVEIGEKPATAIFEQHEHDDEHHDD